MQQHLGGDGDVPYIQFTLRRPSTRLFFRSPSATREFSSTRVVDECCHTNAVTRMIEEVRNGTPNHTRVFSTDGRISSDSLRSFARLSSFDSFVFGAGMAAYSPCSCDVIHTFWVRTKATSGRHRCYRVGSVSSPVCLEHNPTTTSVVESLRERLPIAIILRSISLTTPARTEQCGSSCPRRKNVQAQIPHKNTKIRESSPR